MVLIVSVVTLVDIADDRVGGRPVLVLLSVVVLLLLRIRLGDLVVVVWCLGGVSARSGYMLFIPLDVETTLTGSILLTGCRYVCILCKVAF